MSEVRGLAWLAFTLVASSAKAEDVASLPDVPLVVVGCPRDYEAELRASLLIEIDALAQERPSEPRPKIGQIRVECSGEASVRVEVLSVRGQRAKLDLDQREIAPDARVRALALSTTELVDSLSAPARPAARIENRPSSTPLHHSRESPSLLLGPLVERVGRPPTWLFGGSLSFEVPLARFLAPVVEARGEAGSFGVETARVRVDAWSGSLHLLVGSHAERWRWGAGPGVRLGIVTLRGDPGDSTDLRGASTRSWWGGPGIKARIAYAWPAVPVVVSLSGDAGLVAWAVVGTLDDTRRVFALDGAWVGVTLGAGVKL